VPPQVRFYTALALLQVEHRVTGHSQNALLNRSATMALARYSLAIMAGSTVAFALVAWSAVPLPGAVAAERAAGTASSGRKD